MTSSTGAESLCGTFGESGGAETDWTTGVGTTGVEVDIGIDVDVDMFVCTSMCFKQNELFLRRSELI